VLSTGGVGHRERHICVAFFDLANAALDLTQAVVLNAGAELGGRTAVAKHALEDHARIDFGREGRGVSGPYEKGASRAAFDGTTF